MTPDEPDFDVFGEILSAVDRLAAIGDPSGPVAARLRKRVARYTSYYERDAVEEVSGMPRSGSTLINQILHPEPSAIDKLAAIEDPDGEAAERIKTYDDFWHQFEQSRNRLRRRSKDMSPDPPIEILGVFGEPPSAVDRLAAIEDPDGEAAERVKAAEKRAKMAKNIDAASDEIYKRTQRNPSNWIRVNPKTAIEMGLDPDLLEEVGDE